MTEPDYENTWIKTNSLIEKLEKIKEFINEELNNEKNNIDNAIRRKRIKISDNNHNKYSLKLINKLYTMDLPAFAQMYLYDINYRNDIYTPNCGAIFNAYLKYKNNIEIPYEYAEKIIYKTSILLHNKDVVITANMLIEEYEKNDNFFVYLKNILKKDDNNILFF